MKDPLPDSAMKALYRPNQKKQQLAIDHAINTSHHRKAKPFNDRFYSRAYLSRRTGGITVMALTFVVTK